MRWLLILILSFFTLTSFSQTDSTTLSPEEIIALSKKVEEQKITINKQAKLIKEQKAQLEDYKQQELKDSFLLAFEKDKNALLQSRVIYYEDWVANVKPKWYDGKVVSFVLGAGTIILSSWVISNIND